MLFIEDNTHVCWDPYKFNILFMSFSASSFSLILRINMEYIFVNDINLHVTLDAVF
jgi:hypothetical protein